MASSSSRDAMHTVMAHPDLNAADKHQIDPQSAQDDKAGSASLETVNAPGSSVDSVQMEESFGVSLHEEPTPHTLLDTLPHVFSVMQIGVLGSEENKRESHSPQSTDLVAVPQPHVTTQNVVRDLDTLIREVLPYELKLAVLKEVVRLWATNIVDGPKYPIDRFKRNVGEKAIKHPPTNRAMLLHLSMVPHMNPTWSSHNRLPNMNPTSVTSQHRLGWCSIPVTIDGCGDSAGTWQAYLEELTGPNSPRPSRFTSPNTWKPFQISKILELTACSKLFYPAMRTFFFSHMTWIFTRKSQLYDVFENPSCRLPQTVLGSMKSICLEVGRDYHDSSDIPREANTWDTFVNLFEYLLELSSRPISPLTGITTLEINGHRFDSKVTNKGNHHITVTDEKIRTKYLVTRCFQLANHLPNIKILLSGGSQNTITKLNPAEHRRIDGHRIRRLGLGYTPEQVGHFLRTRHQMKLTSLEILDEQNNPYTHRYTRHLLASVEWKILFVQEWQKVWELGLKDDVNEKGYDGVEDPEITRNTYNADDNDLDISDNDS